MWFKCLRMILCEGTNGIKHCNMLCFINTCVWLSLSQWQGFHTPVQEQQWPIEGPIWEGGVVPSITHSALHLLHQPFLPMERECHKHDTWHIHKHIQLRHTLSNKHCRNLIQNVTLIYMLLLTHTNTYINIYIHWHAVRRRMVTGKQKGHILIEQKIWFQSGWICLCFF